MKNNQKILNRVILIAMFSALCCAGTFVQIRMPAGDFVHLGNFVMIVSALLMGAVAGGCVGSLGMGIYDLIFYSNKPSTIIRTFVLKFIIGFLVGYLFRLILKKKINTRVFLYVLGGVFGALFVVSTIFFILGDKSGMGFKNGLTSIYHITTIAGKKYNASISLYIPIFSFIFSAGLIASAIFAGKLSDRRKAVLFAVTVAILANIIGEFVLRWLLEGLMVSDFNTSLVVATSKIPGSVITGFISVVLSVLIYEPIYKAVKNNNMFEDDTAEVEDSNNEEV